MCKFNKIHSSFLGKETILLVVSLGAVSVKDVKMMFFLSLSSLYFVFRIK